MIITAFKDAYLHIIPLIIICGISYISCELIWFLVCFMDKQLCKYLTKNMRIKDDYDES